MNHAQKFALAQRYAGLSQEKQQKFLALLKEQGIDFAQLPIVPQQRGPRSRLSFAPVSYTHLTLPTNREV